MHVPRTATLILAALAIAAAPASAATPPANVPTDTPHVVGTVVSVTPDVLTLDTGEKVMELHFTEAYPRPMELVENNRVEVWYRQEPSGTGQVSVVKIVPMEATTGAAAAASSPDTTTSASSDTTTSASSDTTTAASSDTTTAASSDTTTSASSDMSGSTSSGTNGATSSGRQAATATTARNETAGGNDGGGTMTEQPKTLPQTASDLPLIGLLGTLALFAGAALRTALRG